jgi:hypothetical protein
MPAKGRRNDNTNPSASVIHKTPARSRASDFLQAGDGRPAFKSHAGK